MEKFILGSQNTVSKYNRLIQVLVAGALRAVRRTGARSNVTDFRFCDLQNRRRQCRSFVQIMMRSQKKKGIHRNSNVFFGQN